MKTQLGVESPLLLAPGLGFGGEWHILREPFKYCVMGGGHCPLSLLPEALAQQVCEPGRGMIPAES